MLKENKPKFENKIHEALKNGMYKAFYNMCLTEGGDEISEQIKNHNKKIAGQFSKIIADEIYEPLAEAIDEYIKSMDIYATVNPGGIALSGATGPVTGVINITPQTTKLEIR